MCGGDGNRQRSPPTVSPFDRIADQVPKSLLYMLAGKLGFVAREQTRARIAEWAARVRELSLRQRQVMGLVAQGLSNKDIELSRRREIAQLS